MYAEGIMVSTVKKDKKNDAFKKGAFKIVNGW